MGKEENDKYWERMLLGEHWGVIADDRIEELMGDEEDG